MFKKLKNQSHKKIFSVFLAIFIILAGFAFYPQPTQAFDMPSVGTILNVGVGNPATIQSFRDGNNGKDNGDICPGVSFVTSPLKGPILCVLLAILGFITWILGVATAIFSATVDVNVLHNVIANPAIYTAWGQIRDVLNIAFILFLLYAAFSIIFQVGGKYGEKKIILTIVLMALLVNFSFPITRVIIDASNSLMFTLMSQLMPTAAANPYSFIGGISEGSDMATILTSTQNNASIIQVLAAIVFTFILAMTFLALAILFLVRIAALALLIITSPVAFVGNIAGKDFGWWDMLFKYALFGPVMILLLAISISIMSALSSSASVNFGDDNIIAAMANMSIPIVVLWMSMGIAQKMGIAGASGIMGAAQNASKWVGQNFTGQKGLGSATAHWANRSLANTKAGKFISPMAIKAAWNSRVKRLDEEALAKSTGGLENAMNVATDWASNANPYYLGKRLLRGYKAANTPGGSFRDGFTADYDKVDYDFIRKQQAARKEEKEMAEVSENSDYIIRRANLALGNGNFEEFHGAIMNLAKNNNINDLMYGALGKKYGSNGVMDPIVAKNVMKQMYMAAGADEQTAARNLSIISGIGEGKGNMALAGWSEMSADGNFKVTNDEAQAAIALAKWGEMEPQDRQKKLHKDGLFTTMAVKGADGKTAVKIVGVGKIQSAIFEGKVSGGDLKQVERIRTDTSEMIHNFVAKDTKTNATNAEIASALSGINNTFKDIKFSINPGVSSSIANEYMNEASRFFKEGPKGKAA